jgi:curli biogenesis system outer membrane secretion channel CsgG
MQHQIPADQVRIVNASIQPVASVRNLVVQLDCDASMASHVRFVSMQLVLRGAQRVKSATLRHALLTLVQALVVSI